jgi:hypothetical protein
MRQKSVPVKEPAAQVVTNIATSVNKPMMAPRFIRRRVLKVGCLLGHGDVLLVLLSPRGL